jgi:hypothetical protein
MAWFDLLSTTTLGINELTSGVDSNHGMVFLSQNHSVRMDSHLESIEVIQMTTWPSKGLLPFNELRG